MAAAAAMERSTAPADRALVMAAAVVITLAAHLLPTIANNRTRGKGAAAWALWAVCMALTVYGHMVFFASAAGHAGSSRAATVEETAHSRALREQLASISARPLGTVAADLVMVQHRASAANLQAQRCEQATPGRCASRRTAAQQAHDQVEALRTEHTEAQRAADLRGQLTTAAASLDTRRTSAASDPVASQLNRLTGTGADALPLMVAVLSSIVVELLAALLWSEALRDARAPEAAEQAVPDFRQRHVLAELLDTGTRPRAPIPAMSPARRVRPQSTAPPNAAPAT